MLDFSLSRGFSRCRLSIHSLQFPSSTQSDMQYLLFIM